MPNFEEILGLDATAQAELIRRKEIKPIELVDAVIEQIERLNPQLNAVVTPMYDMARKEAKGALPDGPFSGVPFLLKDLILEVKGTRLTEGSAYLKNYVSDHDSELAIRYKKAGLIFTGKTSTCEFGLMTTTEPKLFGPCRNPWNTNKTTGGSSGGSAAAVASGIVPMAYGNDGGGSIRIPASCCGVFGLKPSRGRNPLGPEYSILGGNTNIATHGKFTPTSNRVACHCSNKWFAESHYHPLDILQPFGFLDPGFNIFPGCCLLKIFTGAKGPAGTG